MTEDNGLPSDWATAAGDYLARNQQLSDDGKSWDHTFTSAYQMSCKALAALGYAEETDWGAVPLKGPSVPSLRKDSQMLADLRVCGDEEDRTDFDQRS